MRLDVDLKGLDGVLETLKRLPPEVVSRRGGPVLFALRKGANVIRNQARTNLQASIDAPGKTGITISTGFTVKNVVAKRRKIWGGGKGERMVITVNPKPHPIGHTIKDRPLRANDIAFMMEHGTSKQDALPWLRPAFEAKKEEALRTVETELVKKVNQIIKKLSAKNGVK